MRTGGPFSRGILRENPLFVFLLGLCPALAVSSRAADAIVLGLGMLFIIPGAALLAPVLSRLRRLGLRSFLSVAAVGALVTIFELLAASAFPVERERMGIYIPILAANCLVLGHVALSTATRGDGDPFPDALGMAAGFAGSLLLISLLREGLGSGRITLFPVGGFSGTLSFGFLASSPARVLVLPAGGLLILGYLLGLKRVLFDRGGEE